VNTGKPIVGFGDTQFASYIEPSLTIVKEPTYKEGAMAAEMLVKLINDEEVKESQVMLETKLIIRESCGSKMAKILKG